MGVKGTEQISEGLAVGFVLEHGFSSDTGAKGDADRFFNRESMVQIISDYGTFAFGRMGTINSDAGTFGFYSGAVNPFGTGWNAIPGVGDGLFASAGSRMDNMITYKSPTFAGATVYAQYSTGQNGQDENKNTADRYAALGVNYVNGGLNLAAVVDWMDEAESVANYDQEDMYTINVGGSYDFGVMKPYLAVQYFKNADDAAGVVGVAEDAKIVDVSFDKLKGYGVALGVDVPAFGGNFLASIGYLDAEDDITNGDDVTAYTVGAAYTYPLSKRTNIYLTGAYNNREVEGNDGWKFEQDEYQVTTGIVHKF